MANPVTRIILSAVDRTKAVFTSVKGGLASLGSSAAGLTSQLGLIFTGLSVAGFVGALKSAIDKMDEAYNSAQKIGTSTENFSALAYAAKQSNVPVEDLEKSLLKLARGIDAAKEGSGPAAEAFKRLGIDPKKFTDPADALLVIADRFAAMPNGVNKAALAMALFGKSGADMIPLLNEGSAGIKRMTDEAERFGVVVSGEAGAAADQFNDSLDKLKAAGSGLGITLANDILPGLSEMTDQMAEAAKQGGLLAAIKAGLKFSVGDFLTNESLSPIYRLAEAEKQLQALRKDDFDEGHKRVVQIKEYIPLLKVLADEEHRAADAKAASAEKSKAAGQLALEEADLREESAKALKKSVNEQIADADRLQGALQSAFSKSIDAEEDYLKQAKKLRAEASGGTVGDGPEAQALAALDATIAAMRLQRTAATDSLDSVQQQAEALRALAANVDDVAKQEAFRRQANLAEAAALERAAAEEKARYQGLAEQQNEATRRSENLKAALDGIGKEVSVAITPGAQTEATLAKLAEIKTLIDYIKSTPVSVGGSNNMAETLRLEALKRGNRR